MIAHCWNCNREYVTEPGRSELRLCKCEKVVDADPLGVVVRDPDGFLAQRECRASQAWKKSGWVRLEDGTLDKCVVFDRELDTSLKEIAGRLVLTTWHIVNDASWTDEQRADIIAELFFGPSEPNDNKPLEYEGAFEHDHGYDEIDRALEIRYDNEQEIDA